MRRVVLTCLVVSVLCVGCDAVYHVKMSLTPRLSADRSGQTLDEADRRRALDLLEAQAKALNLDCRESSHPIKLGSYGPGVQLVECSARTKPEMYVDVLFANGDSTLAVEVFEIGRLRPSAYFRRVSKTFRAVLTDEFGENRISVEDLGTRPAI